MRETDLRSQLVTRKADMSDSRGMFYAPNVMKGWGMGVGVCFFILSAWDLWRASIFELIACAWISAMTQDVLILVHFCLCGDIF